MTVHARRSLLYVEYSPPGSNLLMFPCQVEEKSETIRGLDDDLLRELEEKLLEMSQIMDPGVMAENWNWLTATQM